MVRCSVAWITIFGFLTVQVIFLHTSQFSILSLWAHRGLIGAELLSADGINSRASSGHTPFSLLTRSSIHRQPPQQTASAALAGQRACQKIVRRAGDWIMYRHVWGFYAQDVRVGLNQQKRLSTKCALQRHKWLRVNKPLLKEIVRHFFCFNKCTRNLQNDEKNKSVWKLKKYIYHPPPRC